MEPNIGQHRVYKKFTLCLTYDETAILHEYKRLLDAKMGHKFNRHDVRNTYSSVITAIVSRFIYGNSERILREKRKLKAIDSLQALFSERIGGEIFDELRTIISSPPKCVYPELEETGTIPTTLGGGNWYVVLRLSISS